jgi:catechol 2,3-dioxygenase-like lactoylglutathione lyase family enzyme
MRLEVVVIPVADVDRAKDFYKALGWREDADFAGDAGFRVVQVTPPGSACSVIFGSRITSAAPGSAQGLQLVVDDIDGARAELIDHGAGVSEVFHDAGGVFHHAGTEGRVPHHPPAGPLTGEDPAAGRTGAGPPIAVPFPEGEIHGSDLCFPGRPRRGAPPRGGGPRAA